MSKASLHPGSEDPLRFAIVFCYLFFNHQKDLRMTVDVEYLVNRGDQDALFVIAIIVFITGRSHTVQHPTVLQDDTCRAKDSSSPRSTL